MIIKGPSAFLSPTGEKNEEELTDEIN